MANISVVSRRFRATERRLHITDNMRHRLHSHRVGDTVRPVPQKEAATSTRLPSAPTASRPVGVIQAAPAARLRGIRRTVCERRQCLMVALSFAIVIVELLCPSKLLSQQSQQQQKPPPAILYYSYRVTRHSFLIIK